MNSEREQLAQAARLFGRLLVRELDPATLDELRQTEVRDALAAVGVTVPEPEQLDQLAHEWLASLLHPAHASPPVHSLFRDGNYNGDPAVAVRRIAQAAGLEPALGARNAPVDHIGCILLLWGELATTRSELADLLAAEHLQWAERALLWLADSDSPPSCFYRSVARATRELIGQLRSLASTEVHDGEG